MTTRVNNSSYPYPLSETICQCQCSPGIDCIHSTHRDNVSYIMITGNTFPQISVGPWTHVLSKPK